MSIAIRKTSVTGFLRSSSFAALVVASMAQAVPALAQDAPADEESDDRIIVTGSRIANVAPVGATVTAIGRDDIETGGQVTLDKMIQDLPAVLDLGFSDNSRAQSGGNGNATLSNSINLRGLGPFSTLIISDGHRMTTNGRAISPSVLPTLGVERVEVIADGASAIYGSDAVAGVVNLIPRRNLDGVEAFGRIGTSDDGAFWEWNAGVAVGSTFDRGQFMVAYEHAFRSNLQAADRDFATTDLRSRRGPNYSVNQCAPGTLTYKGTNYALPTQYSATNANTLVAGTQNLCDNFASQDIFPQQEYNSVNATATYEFLDGVEFIFDGYYSRRTFARLPGSINRTFTVPETNAFFVRPSFYVNGSGGYSINYAFDSEVPPDEYTGFQENYQLTPGIRADLFGDWTFEGRYGFGKAVDRADSNAGINATAFNTALASNNAATAFDPYGGGRTSAATLATIFNAEATFPLNAAFDTWQAGVNGTVFNLPGGEVKVALGYEGQEQQQTRNAGLTNQVTNSRTIHSGYGELNIPIFGPANATAGFQELTITAAVRYDHYSDVGATTNPKFGINWEPFYGFKLRGSYGTSFRAPTFPEIFGNSTALFVQNHQNPTGGAALPVFKIGSGPNPDLQPETATTWTVGADIEPLDGLTIGVTYFDIDYQNTITGLLSNLAILTFANEYAGTDVILFGKAAYDRIVNIRTNGIGGTPGPIDVRVIAGASTACLDAPTPTYSNCIFADGRSLNLGRSQMQGLDFTLRYFADIGPVDTLTVTTSGTLLTAYNVAFTPGGPLTDQQNNIFQPLTFKARAAVAWGHGPFNVRAQVSHIGSYINNIVTPVETVDSFTMVDLNFGWEINESFDLPGERLSLGLEVRNLFNRQPPFVNARPGQNSAGGFDATASDPIGRQFAVSLRSSF